MSARTPHEKALTVNGARTSIPPFLHLQICTVTQFLLYVLLTKHTRIMLVSHRCYDYITYPHANARTGEQVVHELETQKTHNFNPHMYFSSDFSQLS